MNLGPRLHFLRSIHRLLTLRDGILHQPHRVNPPLPLRKCIVKFRLHSFHSEIKD